MIFDYIFYNNKLFINLNNFNNNLILILFMNASSFIGSLNEFIDLDHTSLDKLFYHKVPEKQTIEEPSKIYKKSIIKLNIGKTFSLTEYLSTNKKF